jgi:hypothetical protein
LYEVWERLYVRQSVYGGGWELPRVNSDMLSLTKSLSVARHFLLGKEGLFLVTLVDEVGDIFVIHALL